ncbi:MAG: HAD family hydrolase [Deltaproteobacteria bacterium]|nr:HAD family hydrolase [Deltaproteobacteria bacterium]
MSFIALQAMKDMPRPEASEAIAQDKGAGIRIVMITGDNALTARAVGRQINIGEHYVESSELESLSGVDLRERMKQVDIIARATPQTKQHVLQAL